MEEGKKGDTYEEVLPDGKRLDRYGYIHPSMEDQEKMQTENVEALRDYLAQKRAEKADLLLKEAEEARTREGAKPQPESESNADK